MSHYELIKKEKVDSSDYMLIVWWWISINYCLYSLHLESRVLSNQISSVMVYDNSSNIIHISNCWIGHQGRAQANQF